MVQQEVRLKLAKQGGRYRFRNNNGAFKDATGRMVRYGLGNDSKRVNEKFKTGDLIGWDEVVITADMVGKTVAIFASDEIKRSDWKPSNSDRDVAQANWRDFVNKHGGRGRILTDADEV